jgi:putative hydrolase of the HAD superfamily
MVRPTPTALLVDLDGALRRWDPAVVADIEVRHGLKPGAVTDAAMQWSRLHPATTGRVGHAEWMARVGAALADEYGPAAAVAVQEWQAYRGEVDAAVLAFVREVRAAGIRVGLATNGTDLLEADLDGLALTDEVDVVVNAARLRTHKPTRQFFQQACLALATPPDHVLFVDDTDRFVRGARAAGLSAYRWSGAADLPYLRAVLGL